MPKIRDVLFWRCYLNSWNGAKSLCVYSKISDVQLNLKFQQSLKEFSRNKLSMKMHASSYIILSILLFSGFTVSTKKKKQSKHEEKKTLKKNIDNLSNKKIPNEGKIILKKEIFDRFSSVISFLKNSHCLLDVLLIKGCLRICFLTHFSPMSHFYAPWKRQKTIAFLTFLEGIEMWYWTKIG